MPANTQGMFDDLSAPEGADGSIGYSNKSSLKRGFPSAIHHDNNPTTELRETQSSTPVQVNLDREAYKKAYEEHVLSGVRNIPGADFNNVDMDYGTSPGTSQDLQPPNGIHLLDGDDNTIAPGGLGPNVATLDIESFDPGAGVPMVEAGSPTGAPFVPPQSTVPFQSSVKISSGDLYGGGIKGESNAGES